MCVRRVIPSKFSDQLYCGASDPMIKNEQKNIFPRNENLRNDSPNSITFLFNL